MPPLLLLVEDSPDVTFIVQRYGRQAGQEVVACGTAAEGWDYLAAGGRPDLLLLDVNLPGEDGLELCRRLRAAAWPDLPVAVFGHRERPGDVAAGLDAGADFLVIKDLLARPDAWQARLAEILTPVDSRPAGLSLSWTQQVRSPLPGEALEALNQAVRHAASAHLGAEIVPALFRRALCRVGQRMGTPPDGFAGWLGPHGLEPAAVAQAGRAEAVRALMVALTEQVWCLLGTAAGASFGDALAAAVLPFTGTPPR
jgi:CheY-like chemotaxis protein